MEQQRTSLQTTRTLADETGAAVGNPARVGPPAPPPSKGAYTDQVDPGGHRRTGGGVTPENYGILRAPPAASAPSLLPLLLVAVGAWWFWG